MFMDITRKAAGFIKLIMFAGLVTFIAVGCSSGGGGDDDSGNTTAPVQEGIFVDSPVEGLHYSTDTHSGITDAEGRFEYMEGEDITFSIGGVMLGHAQAQEFMTPAHLVEGAVDENHPTVTNMGRFMQSLDADGDPENGITISHEVREEVRGRHIDFHLGMTEFENHPDVTGLFDTLNARGLFHHGEQHLISAEQARQHMREHFNFMGNGGMMGPNPDGGMTEPDMNDGMMGPNTDGGMSGPDTDGGMMT